MMLFFGTICMVNLFIAVIISDTREMKLNASTQSLISMAQLTIISMKSLYYNLIEEFCLDTLISYIVEAILPNRLLKTMMVEPTITICAHEMCSKVKCLSKEDQSIYKKLSGRFSTEDDSTKPNKIRLPGRIDRENFKDRVEKIFKKYQ